MTLRVERLRCFVKAKQEMAFPSPASNLLRGALGKALHGRGDGSYEAFFAPRSERGPSGLADPPRPFVLRAHHLDGKRVSAGELYHFDLHLFTSRWMPAIEAERVEREVVEIRLEDGGQPATRLGVQFVTPTELKGSGGLQRRPEFGVLMARIRDRISTLSTLYGEGPPALDYAAFGARAAAVRLVRCELHQIAAERRSARTGQRHPLGGFAGEVEYEGDLAEFLPWLRAAEWTGVGRQTVWGKGAILLRRF